MTLSSSLPPILFSAATLGILAVLPASRAAGPGGANLFDPDADQRNLHPIPKLQIVQSLQHEALGDVTSVTIGPKGMHVYAAAFNPGVISILERDEISGRLTFRKSMTDDDHKGAVAFRLSKDGTMGAASCFRSETLVLYSVDPDNGDLKKLDVAGGAAKPIEGLDFCIDNTFSPDGQHLYSVGSSAICVFEIDAGKLKLVETIKSPPRIEEPEDKAALPANRMSNGRGIAISPDGTTLYTTWSHSGALMVHRRDPKSGKLTHIQALENDGNELIGLDGVMRVTVSRDGRFVYTSSGRFGGTDAVCTFERRMGSLVLLQSLIGEELPAGFKGGNEIILSPDHRDVAVACTLSDTVARFSRDRVTGHLTATGSDESKPAAKPGPAGLIWSLDGRFIYVADEKSGCIVTFRTKAW
jgi:6-phosphogluconolactonase (cycloisomerase 2 family)